MNGKIEHLEIIFTPLSPCSMGNVISFKCEYKIYLNYITIKRVTRMYYTINKTILTLNIVTVFLYIIVYYILLFCHRPNHIPGCLLKTFTSIYWPPLTVIGAL